jgi:hypothetical protein
MTGFAMEDHSHNRSGLGVPWNNRFKCLLELAKACDVPVK